jgi:hypothetical protein
MDERGDLGAARSDVLTIKCEGDSSTQSAGDVISGLIIP